MPVILAEDMTPEEVERIEAEAARRWREHWQRPDRIRLAFCGDHQSGWFRIGSFGWRWKPVNAPRLFSERHGWGRRVGPWYVSALPRQP